MSSTVVWLGSTAALWVICTVAYTAIEALVHDYRTRFAIMVVAGTYTEIISFPYMPSRDGK